MKKSTKVGKLRPGPETYPVAQRAVCKRNVTGSTDLEIFHWPTNRDLPRSVYDGLVLGDGKDDSMVHVHEVFHLNGIYYKLIGTFQNFNPLEVFRGTLQDINTSLVNLQMQIFDPSCTPLILGESYGHDGGLDFNLYPCLKLTEQELSAIATLVKAEKKKMSAQKDMAKTKSAARKIALRDKLLKEFPL